MSWKVVINDDDVREITTNCAFQVGRLYFEVKLPTDMISLLTELMTDNTVVITNAEDKALGTYPNYELDMFKISPNNDYVYVTMRRKEEEE